MTARELFFVRDNGHIDRLDSASFNKLNPVEGDDQDRLDSLLIQRNISATAHICDGGVRVIGGIGEAATIHRLWEQMPYLVPSSAALREQRAVETTQRIAPTFGDAAARKVISMRPDFIEAVGEDNIRVVPFGSKASIRGSYGHMQLAA